MQQAVQASQIHEYAEVGDVFHNTLSQLSDLDFRQDFFLAAPAFLLYEFAPGYDNVSAFYVYLENRAIHFFADEPADIARFPDIHLRSRQEHRHSDIDQQASLNSPYDLAFNNITLSFRIENCFPTSHEVGFAFVQ